MAHGIGGIKAGGLAPFAERFRDEGFVAIAFDYRNFGGSGGKPREVLSFPRQRADYSTVIRWAVEQPYVDPRQIIAWGTSFAGMHVVELAFPTLDSPQRSRRLRSPAAMSVSWLCRKLRQVGEGTLGRHGRYLPTVAWLTSMPSLSSSPWMRGAPQSGLARLIWRIRSRISVLIWGRPGRRDRHRQ